MLQVKTFGSGPASVTRSSMAISPIDLEIHSSNARNAARVEMEYKWARLQIGYKEYLRLEKKGYGWLTVTL
jgi:hypothetical protein